MEKVEFELTEVRYKRLRDMCKAGTAGTTAVKEDKRKTAENVQHYCGVCAANKPEIAFWLKLFALHDWFVGNLPAAPEPESEEAAAQYLSDCLSRVRRQAESLPDEAVAATAFDAASKYGVDFTGKLIHSSAVDAFAFASDNPTTLPHLTARRLRQAGVDLVPDQSANDNTGAYQQVLKVLMGHELIAAAGVSDRMLGLLKQGAQDGMRAARAKRSSRVDHRLRQLLLPSGDTYLSVSPLVSGYMCVKVSATSRTLEAAWREQAEQEAKQKSSAQHKADPQADPQAALPHEQSAMVKPGKRSTKASTKAKASAKTSATSGEMGLEDGGEGGAGEEVDAAVDASKVWGRRIFRLELAAGGANPQNVTAHSSNLQNPMFFLAPQRQGGLASVVRFFNRSWRPLFQRSQVDAALNQIAAMNDTNVLGQSVSLLAVQAQAQGALAALVREAHQQAKEFAETLAVTRWEEDGDDRLIDVSLVKAKRKRELDPLDTCLINFDFGVVYRESLAHALIARLHGCRFGPEDGIHPLAPEVTRRRLASAIVQILEQTR